MNKKINNSLSSHDKELVALIGRRFELAEQILGTEPGIYYEFNIRPASEIAETTPVMHQRQELFSKSAPVKPKEA